MNCYSLCAAIFLSLVLISRPSGVFGQEATDMTEGATLTTPDKVPAQNTFKQPRNESREGFTNHAAQAIRDFDLKIATLGKKVKAEGLKIKGESKEVWQDVKRKQKAAKKELKKLSSAAEEAWEESKSKVRAALDDLRKAYKKAASHFN